MADSCDPHVYEHVDAAHRDMLIAELGKAGATVTGSYDIDTHKSGVKLHADYDEPNQRLTVSIVDRPHVPLMDVCAKVWESIDPAVNKVLATPIVKDPSDPTAAGALGKIGANTGGGGVLSDADRAAFTNALQSLDDVSTPSEGSGAQGAGTQGAGVPTASAAGTGIAAWLTAHPVLAVAAVAGLGFVGYKLIKS